MKRIALTILLTTLIANCYCQQIHSIKFIYDGQTLHPVGIVIISVGKVIKTSRDITNKMYGTSVKTDINTYNCLKQYIETSKLNISEKESLHVDHIRIVISNGITDYVAKRNYYKFYVNLKAIILGKNLDRNVLDAIYHQ
jgi:hypothetical protein